VKRSPDPSRRTWAGMRPGAGSAGLLGWEEPAADFGEGERSQSCASTRAGKVDAVCSGGRRIERHCREQVDHPLAFIFGLVCFPALVHFSGPGDGRLLIDLIPSQPLRQGNVRFLIRLLLF
jgi:hypothetical protein